MASYRQIKKFPIRVGSHPDEPLVAVVNRRAIQNGIDNIADAWTFVGGTLSELSKSPRLMLATYRCGTSLAAGRTFWASPLHLKQFTELMGNTYRRGQIDGTRIRWCAQCLKDEPYFRSIWSIKAYKNCAIHGSALHDRCTDCGRTQIWPNSGAPHDIVQCKCGHRFDCVPEGPPQENTCRKIDSWLYQNAAFHVSLRRKRTWPAELLTDGMKYHYALECFSRLGAYALDPAGQFQATVAKFDPSELMNRGLDCASRDGFWFLLDTLVTNHRIDELSSEDGSNPYRRLEAKYGQLAEWLLGKRSVAPFERMIDTLLHHNDLGRLNSQIDRSVERIPRGKFVTIKQVSEAIGIKISSLWEKLQFFDYVIPIDTSDSFELPMHVLDRLREPGSTLLSYREIAESLSVSESLARELLTAGCLSEDPKRAGSKQLAVKQAQIAQVLSRLEASFAAGREDDDLVSILGVRSVGPGRAGLVKMILDGKLAIRKIKPARHGLQRYMVAADEIERALQQESKTIRIQEAMRLLRMNEGEVNVLIENKYIVTTNRGNLRLLQIEDVISCMRKFVGERSAMKDLGASRSLLRAAIQRIRYQENICIQNDEFVVYTRIGFESIQSQLNKRYGSQLKFAI